ncbi:hypothetical protein PVAP13_3KG124268 [Panicum virgatum]|uniref:Uncharacterized protein n=1 Tax=Panicum virgatum TaxID=38727 RepID=A0A8T0USI2_PANVG|nr:hypothetical protein PVAP13_3KG124268 [Panicum virgatum]
MSVSLVCFCHGQIFKNWVFLGIPRHQCGSTTEAAATSPRSRIGYGAVWLLGLAQLGLFL